jgi:hypothetical protein
MTDEEKLFDQIQQRAVHNRPVRLLVGRHRSFDPALGGGPYWLRVKRAADTFDLPNPFLLKYATLEKIDAYLKECKNDY